MAQARKTEPKGDEAATVASKTEGAAPEVHPALRIICHVGVGRRRGGRAWEAGETPVEADELTEDQLSALEADPLFAVLPAN